jgi:hypothetical protein
LSCGRWDAACMLTVVCSQVLAVAERFGDE